MRKISYILALAVAGACCQKQEVIELSFDVSSPVSDNVVVVCGNKISEVELDSLGHGTMVLDGMDAAYARVFYGTGYRLIYAEKGDKAEITFDGNDFNGTFRLEGKKGPAVKYLNTVVMTALPDEDYALPFDDFLQKIKDKTSEAAVLLRDTDLKGTGKFREMEEARIRYAYGIQLLLYPTAHVLMAHDPQYVPDETYFGTIRGYWEENPMYADIQEYREFMTESAHILDPEGRDIRELYPKLVAEMRYIASECRDTKVRQALLHHIAMPYIENFGTGGTEDMAGIYLTYVDDPALTSEFKAECDRWDRKKPGKLSADFKATDIEGNEFSLADFRGKYLFIDLWATWCRPCMMEVPHLAELEKEFEGRCITFLGLSVDADRQDWEAKVGSGEMPGIQLYLGNESSFLDAYEVRSIPRFILLDKEGRIVNPEMTRPSSGDTEKFLSGLGGI